MSQPEGCKCSFRTYMLGDGCDVCNPALALEYANETIVELEQQRDGLLAAMIEFRKTGTHTEDFKKWLDSMISRVEGNL